MDIFTYLKKRREFAYRLQIPTDSVITEIEADMNTVHIRKAYEVETVLKEAARMREINESNNGFTRGKQMRHVAVYPRAVHLMYWRQAKGDVQEYNKLVNIWLKTNTKFCTVPPNSF